MKKIKWTAFALAVLPLLAVVIMFKWPHTGLLSTEIVTICILIYLFGYIGAIALSVVARKNESLLDLFIIVFLLAESIPIIFVLFFIIACKYGDCGPRFG